MADFQLRAELRGHLEDVRSLCITPDGSILTGSRDTTIKLWTEGQYGAFAETMTLVGHTDFVSALAYAPQGVPNVCQGAAVVSGSRDTTVLVWNAQSAAVVQKLEGHEYQVTAVLVTSDGDIVSASLDKTIRVWRGGECVHVLRGHEAAVLCLLQLPNGDLLSGSGDCTMRVWSGYTCTHTIAAHKDSVRGLALLPGVGVVSASHDETLKVWSLEGQCQGELRGHTGIIYTCAATADGLVASGSEDNTTKLWHADGTCLQTLDHPSNLWAVAFLPSGDLVTACSDHVARVWTQAEARRGPAELAQAFEAMMAAKAAAAAEQGGGGLPAGLKLQDPAVLLAPGASDGQTIVVAEGGGGAAAYAWDSAKGEWERIGEVTGGPAEGDTLAGGGSKWHNGQLWDHVFDVDVEDGALPRKLAINRGDNPYDVADRFLEENGLPQTYREQVVDFILKSTGGGVQAPAVQYHDPLTGTGYVPPPSGGGSQPAAGASSGAGAGGSGGAFAATGGGADPFTGGGGSAGPRHLPAKAYLVYDQVPGRAAIRKKVAELSAALAGGEAAGRVLSDAEAADGGPLDCLLDRAAVAASSSGGPPLPDAELALLTKLLSWPAAQLFPALDLTRLLVLDRAVAAQLAAAAAPAQVDGQLPGLLGAALTTACTEPLVPAAQQTAVRLAVNCFGHQALLAWVQACGSRLLECVGAAASSSNKNVRQGLATLLVNYAVWLCKLASSELEFKSRLLVLAVEVLNASPADDVETRYRALIAVGTLAGEHSKVRSLARELGFLSLTDSLRGAGGKVGEAAAEVAQKLRL
ncbi:hypothetical protein D9Q98_007514 [Chlorella vulgaris]|uniref:Phospholipase A-2-activating protein n=1 Tax=Chlorella vulgaris TaxID=3077 RepID=A0A9D4TLH4_CHLVU|nr:hypothetical protein D9Q98_007514 [Chlorella vulgaris]